MEVESDKLLSRRMVIHWEHAGNSRCYIYNDSVERRSTSVPDQL